MLGQPIPISSDNPVENVDGNISETVTIPYDGAEEDDEEEDLQPML